MNMVIMMKGVIDFIRFLYEDKCIKLDTFRINEYCGIMSGGFKEGSFWSVHDIMNAIQTDNYRNVTCMVSHKYGWFIINFSK